jgi:hypothetical protein
MRKTMVGAMVGRVGVDAVGGTVVGGIDTGGSCGVGTTALVGDVVDSTAVGALVDGAADVTSTIVVDESVVGVKEEEATVTVAPVVVVGMFMENVWSVNRADADALPRGNVYKYTRGDVTLHTSKSTVVNSTATVPLRKGSTTSTRGPICTVVPSASAVARKKARS